jgi:hypothetical protein
MTNTVSWTSSLKATAMTLTIWYKASALGAFLGRAAMATPELIGASTLLATWQQLSAAYVTSLFMCCNLAL